MKKVSIAIAVSAIAVLAVLSVASCRKGNTAAPGSWIFESAKYDAATVLFSSVDSSLTANCSTGTLSVYFPSATVRSGTYSIVSYDSIPLDSAQVYIRFINSNTALYYFSTGTDHVSARVTSSSAGKITVSLPAVYLKSFAAPVPDSSQLTAIMYQQ